MEQAKLICQKCGYEWIPRVGKPKHCPKCQTWNWENHTDLQRDMMVRDPAALVATEDKG